MDAAEKGLHRGQIHGNHFVRHVTVRFGMDLVGGLLIRRIDKTERRSALGIVPIGEELHAVLILDFEILEMQPGGLLRGL